jgi:cell division protein FtsW
VRAIFGKAEKVLANFITWFDTKVQNWATEARLLRWLTFLWLSIGLIALFSASYPVADAEFGDGLYYFKRQLLSVFLGMIGFTVVVRSPIQNILKIAHWGFLVLLGLIIFTLIPALGTNVNGATRWIPIGGFLLQPSELIKPFLVLQSARLFGKWERLRWKVRGIWLGIFALLLAVILLQPNLSTTALCGITIWLIALAAGLPYTYLGTVAIAGLFTGIMSISIQDYQRRRVMSFLNPWSDRMGDGFQLIQSLLAVGSGGTWGSGFGMSQQKLFYLPIQYTDFIFAVFAEEFGFIGGLLLLLLLVGYATMTLIVAIKCRHRINRLVAIGCGTLMVGQSILNIGVATGVLPTTGLPLPLFSYGGNSVIASLLLAGLLIRVARENTQADVVPLSVRV